MCEREREITVLLPANKLDATAPDVPVLSRDVTEEQKFVFMLHHRVVATKTRLCDLQVALDKRAPAKASTTMEVKRRSKGCYVSFLAWEDVWPAMTATASQYQIGRRMLEELKRLLGETGTAALVFC